MVKLEIGLHHGCLGSRQEMSWDGEAKDRTLPWKSQFREVKLVWRPHYMDFYTYMRQLGGPIL